MKKLLEETYFLLFIESLLKNIGLEEMVLALDASLVGRGCICLMINLIYKQRTLSLAFTVFKGKKGHLPEDTDIELIRKLHPLIPESTKKVILLGDGEFDGTFLQHQLSNLQK